MRLLNAQPNVRKWQLLMLLVNLIVLLVGVGTAIFGIVLSSQLQSLSYIPPLYLAIGLGVVVVALVGSVGVLFNPWTLGHKYTLYKCYITVIGLLGSLLLVLAVFMYFVRYSITAKVSMRYDIFHKTDAFTSAKSKTGKENTDDLVHPLQLGMIISIILGVIIIIAYFMSMMLTGFRAWVKNFVSTTAFANLAFGIGMVALGMYLILTYHFDQKGDVDITKEDYNPEDASTDAKRVSLDKSLPLLYLFSFAGALPILIGLMGLIASCCYAMPPLSNMYIVISDVIHFVLVGFLVALFVLFLNTYQDNVNSDLDEFLSSTDAYANEAQYVLSLWQDVSVDDATKAFENYASTDLDATKGDNDYRELLRSMMFDRVQSDFVLLGLVGFVPGLWSLLLFFLQTAYLCISIHRYGGSDTIRYRGSDDEVWEGEEEGKLRLLEGRIPRRHSHSRRRQDPNDDSRPSRDNDDDSDSSSANSDDSESSGASRRRRRRR